jgi:glycosyltransferase involved in cell wall biosynthesis
MYEHFTHYAPLDSPRMKRFATELSTGYADLCDAVIAPSKTIAEILRERGVHTPIHVLPTGVDLDRFASGDGARFRRAEKIPADSIIVGHVGRLATEKNLDFLVHCLVEHARGNPRIHVVIVGDGPESSAIDAQFQNAGLSHRLHLTGTLAARQLADVYRSMNVFAFASRVETQGLVLAEAMAAHVPVVAIDAPAVRDVVRDRSNGRLVVGEETSSFVEALDWATSPENCPGLEIGTATTAKSYSIETTGRKLANLYKSLERRVARPAYSHTESVWSVARRRLHKEWLLAVHRGHALHDTWRAPESNP